MKITEALLAEHVVFHNLFDYIERTLPQLRSLAEVRTLAALLHALLEIHSRVEDQLLIDPLEPSFCQMGQERNFHAEHHEIETHLGHAQTARKVAEAKRCLLRAVLVSRKHFDKEERIVFPLAEKQLSAKSLVHLGRRWAEQRSAADL